MAHAAEFMTSVAAIANHGAAWRWVNGFGDRSAVPDGYTHVTNDYVPVPVAEAVVVLQYKTVYVYTSELVRRLSPWPGSRRC